MSSRAVPWIVLVLLALVVGLPFLLRPAVTGSVEATEGGTLIIYTPHNEQIRYEFSNAFNRFRQTRGEQPIHFDWRTGGTSDIYRQIVDQFTGLIEQAKEDRGIGVDLFFGGGEYEHNKLAKGIETTRDNKKIHIALTMPAELPTDLFAQAFPEPTIGGELLNHPEQRWIGVALSSFGIVYNRVYVDSLGLEAPTTWADLAQPKFFGAVALADPAHSGSIAATYHVILRRKGWIDGWALLRRVYANARYFTAGSSQVPVDVSNGEAAAGMCIDFYGRYQAGAVGHNRVGYIDPAYMTATTADTISLLRGAPHEDLAREFIGWLVSKDAQKLWQRRVGSKSGPTQFELRRQPIRVDLYTPEEKQHWTDPDIDPFITSKPIAAGMPGFYSLVAPASHAIAIDIHDDLTRAWRAILDTDDPVKKAAMLELFDAMPLELTLVWPEGLEDDWVAALENTTHPRHEEAAAVMRDFVDGIQARWKNNSAQRDRDRLKWTLFFRDQYRQVVELAERP